MAKHKRWSDKSKSDTPSKDEEITKVEQKTPLQKEPNDLKSYLVSGTKYVYLIAAATLLSGIFTPITLGVDLEIVLIGVLTLFLGLGGGIIILHSIKTQKTNSVLFFGGIGIIFISLILIYEISEYSLFA